MPSSSLSGGLVRLDASFTEALARPTLTAEWWPIWMNTRRWPSAPRTIAFLLQDEPQQR